MTRVVFVLIAEKDSFAQQPFCHFEIRLCRREAVFEDEITFYNMVSPPGSQDRHQTGALEPIFEIGSVICSSRL